MEVEEAARVGEMCANGKAALGMDLGRARKLLQELPSEVWKEHWGEEPRLTKFVVSALELVWALTPVAAIVFAFILWRWYWGLLVPPVCMLSLLIPHGFPHPHALRWLGLVIAAFIVVGWIPQILPVCFLMTSILARHAMYAWVGASLRRYAARHPQAMCEWVDSGFMVIQKDA